MGAAVWDSNAFSKPIVLVPEHERTAYCGLCQYKFEEGDDVLGHLNLHVKRDDGSLIYGPEVHAQDLQEMLGDLRREN